MAYGPEIETSDSHGGARGYRRRSHIYSCAVGSGARRRRAPSTEYPTSGFVWSHWCRHRVLGWICRRSGSGSVVVVQQSAETFQSFHFATLTDESWIRGDQLVIEALMVAFTVVMRSEFGRRATHRAFAK